MYNIYIEEKKKKYQKDKQLIMEKENKIKEYRQSMLIVYLHIYSEEILPELLYKYQSRVENFVLDMAHDPIIVKNPKELVNNPRQEYFEETKNKIIGKKGIVIKGYVTERERIASQFKENNKYEEKQITRNRDKIHTVNDNQILQSERRFKPRTIIEKFFGEINKVPDRKLDKDVIDNQMREIQSRKILSQESLLRIKEKSNNQDKSKAKQMDFFSNEDGNGVDEYLNKLRIQITQEKKAKNSSVNDKKIKSNNRNKELNQESKQILEDLHLKTHFKAVSTIANYYRDRDSLLQKTKSKKRIAKSLTLDEVNFNENLNEEFENAENQIKNIYTLNRNPYKFDTNSSLNFDLHSLQYLKEIAKNETLFKKNQVKENPLLAANFNSNEKKSEKIFAPQNAKEVSRNIKPSFMENVIEPEEYKEKYLWIDNHNYSVSNQINVIANKILSKCNIRKEKNENNNKMLKSGEGKLMITGGLSIKEFERKLGLKPLKKKLEFVQ